MPKFCQNFVKILLNFRQILTNFFRDFSNFSKTKHTANVCWAVPQAGRFSETFAGFCTRPVCPFLGSSSARPAAALRDFGMDINNFIRFSLVVRQGCRRESAEGWLHVQLSKTQETSGNPRRPEKLPEAAAGKRRYKTCDTGGFTSS